MRIVVLAVALAALSTPALAQGSNSVRGHFRSDGTYVQPHQRTNPDRSTSNNWSSKPNVNPYTGQQGVRNPTPSYGAPSGSIYGVKPQRGTYGGYGY